ncbi:hypothetical protein K1719_002668 [Acacia pycnantha]|nr:hypothetical protein K1719_002668 [Acacia pycnantha]
MALVISKKNSALGSLSLEEDDLLDKNSKKLKNETNLCKEDEWPSLSSTVQKQWEKGILGTSFAEKLQGIKQNEVVPKTQDEGLLFTNGAVSDDDPIESDGEDSEPLCVISKEENRNFPTFEFSEKMKKRLYKPWKQSVIVKLLGRNIGYKILLSILQKLWAKRGVISLINLGNSFFVVKLTNRADYLHALTGGPWMLFDHYLTEPRGDTIIHKSNDKSGVTRKKQAKQAKRKIVAGESDKEALGRREQGKQKRIIGPLDAMDSHIFSPDPLHLGLDVDGPPAGLVGQFWARTTSLDPEDEYVAKTMEDLMGADGGPKAQG